MESVADGIEKQGVVIDSQEEEEEEEEELARMEVRKGLNAAKSWTGTKVSRPSALTSFI